MEGWSFITYSRSMGNYGYEGTKSPAKTGTGYYKQKNIFDLAGNVEEGTLEAYMSTYSYRVFRRT